MWVSEMLDRLTDDMTELNGSCDSDGEESESDASWMTDGTEWETDTEDEEQDEGLCTPAEKSTLTPSISPEDATAAKQAAEKRKLFVKGN